MAYRGPRYRDPMTGALLEGLPSRGGEDSPYGAGAEEDPYRGLLTNPEQYRQTYDPAKWQKSAGGAGWESNLGGMLADSDLSLLGGLQGKYSLDQLFPGTELDGPMGADSRIPKGYVAIDESALARLGSTANAQVIPGVGLVVPETDLKQRDDKIGKFVGTGLMAVAPFTGPFAPAVAGIGASFRGAGPTQSALASGLAAGGSALSQYLNPGASAVGDPFIDAYTPVGTGGGPTGLPLPGAAAGAAGGAMDMGVGLEGLMNYASPAIPGAQAAGGGILNAAPSLANAAGDPFVDAYSQFGTGGGPTGLSLPGAAGGAGMLGAAASLISSAADNFNLSDFDESGGRYAFEGGQGGNAGLEGVTSGGKSMLSGAGSAAGALAQLLKSALGIDVSPGTLGLLGTLGSSALGAFGANQRQNSLEGIANRQQANYQPFLDDAMDMMRNPEKFYQRPEVTGAVEASLRGLSSQVGNPILNPGAIAKQAAYNTGLYNNALNQRLATAMGGQDTLARLQTQAALSGGGVYDALGSGLASATNTQPNMNNLLAQYLQKQMGV